MDEVCANTERCHRVSLSRICVFVVSHERYGSLFQGPERVKCTEGMIFNEVLRIIFPKVTGARLSPDYIACTVEELDRVQQYLI